MSIDPSFVQCDLLFAQFPPETPLYYLREFNEQCMPQGDNSRWFFTSDGTQALNHESLEENYFGIDPALLQITSAQEMQKTCSPRHNYLVVQSFADIRSLLCEIEIFKQLYAHLSQERV